ncbi:MAG: class II glutamine amidotransferase [Deltaproteobacteria bacterium]|nr:class II glutamine amidotransferase [Deltaproteobacteria bacterium]
MPNLLAISFEGELAPSFDLVCLHEGGKLPDGWGIGFYPGGEPSASVLKEPAPPEGSIRSELVRAWEHLASSVFLLHIRNATWGRISDANTQPFCRSWARRDWLFAHSGSLKYRLEIGTRAGFEPVGSTDTELIFCELLGRIADLGWRSIADIDPDMLRLWFETLNDHGSLTTVLSDGQDLVVYADRNGEGSVYLLEIVPPQENAILSDRDLVVDLFRRGAKSRKGVVIASEPLETTVTAGGKPAEWKRIEPGHLVVVRQGALRAVARPIVLDDAPVKTHTTLVPRVDLKRPATAPMRRMTVLHKTVYKYKVPIERSTHTFRLEPVSDKLQKVLSYDLDINIKGQRRDYEDVFGNRVRRILIDTPFDELRIESRARVELLDTDPLSFRPLHERSQIPLVWMPWQRHMLQPYLLPPELPDTELVELTEYAMSFVERNDYDLLDTLLDINSTIFKEYAYRQGTTNLFTTPFDVYVNRRGVCQDFTNLFICLARLLGVPARYTCGYLYTGPKNPNQVQSEASHAWVQLYLPEAGWKGFDPTNGILTQTDHIRVSVGRTWIDATPTAGTIYLGGGGETLEVDVRVEVED